MNTSNAAIIDTSGVRTIANNLKNYNSDIMNISKEAMTILNKLQDYIIISGLNFNDVTTTFNQAFTDTENDLDRLTDVLLNRIIPKYEELYNSVKTFFNQEFASELSSYLKAATPSDIRN